MKLTLHLWCKSSRSFITILHFYNLVPRVLSLPRENTPWYDVSHAMKFRVRWWNSIKNHSFVRQFMSFCINPGLNTFFPNSPPCQVCLVVQSHAIVSRIFPTTWTDSKWRPVPLKREGFLIPNLIGRYLCGSTNGKEICYRILVCREMGVKVLKVTMTWAIRAWRSDR